jgi:aspartyl-tRNA(Asn)/glutamyl-tRNA(Gln) amidotransferase subunit C
MSPPKITLEEVYRVARLARLSPSPAEAEALAHDLSAILDYVAVLNEVDTDAVEPTAHAVTQAAALREDAVVPGLSPDEALSQAPHTQSGGFSVPKVLEVDS